MVRKIIKNSLSVLALASLLSLNLVVSAQTPQRGNVAILLDLSGSMNAQLDGKSRRDVAVEALQKSVTDLNGKASVGLYAFGINFDNSPSSKAQSCEDINKLVDYGKDNSGEINEVLSGLQAKGWTPLAKSISTIGNDLAQFGDSEHHLIILSDGEESCGGDPVSAVEALKQNGVNVIVNTIGLDVDANTKSQLEAIASAGGGQYFDAADASSLSGSLAEAVSKVELEEQVDADFSGDATFQLGGGSFEDAVQLQMSDIDPDKTYNFPKNISKSFLTYKLPKELKAGDVLTIGNIFARYIDVYEDGTISERDTNTYVELKIFNKRKGSIFEARNEGYEFDTAETEIELTEEMLDNSYLFIGTPDYNISAKTKIYFEVEKGGAASLDEEKTEEGTDSETGDNTDLASILESLQGGEGSEASDLSSILNSLGNGESANLAELLGGTGLKQQLEDNKAELSKTEEGRAALEAFGIKPETSLLDGETFGIKNLYLLGGGIGVLVLLVLVGVVASRKKV